jgi:Bor protein
MLLVLGVFSLAGCYHATIETGATPSAQVIKRPFASGWIYGLVPPSTVKAASECPNGVARVETQLSFVNELVSWLTLGIYTPMEITVTCATAASASASATPELVVPANATSEERARTIQEASALSLTRSTPVYVKF